MWFARPQRLNNTKDMKRLIYAASLTLLLASCSSDYKDWVLPQSGAQENPKKVELAVAEASAVNFENLTTDSVEIFKPTVTSSDAFTNTFDVTLHNAAQTETVVLKADAQGRVLTSALKEAVEKLYGKRPVERTVKMDIASYTNIDGQSFKKTATTELKVKLHAALFIDEAYYLLFKVNNKWEKANAKQFEHSTRDVYDDPAFNITVTTTQANQEWVIVTKTNYDSNNIMAEGATGVLGFATAGNTDVKGTLTTTSPQSGLFAAPAIYKVSINMSDYSYTLVKMNYAEFIYVPGAGNGWSPEKAPTLQSPSNDGVYTGFAYLSGGFKFTKERNWSGGEYNYTDFTTFPAGFTADGTNIVAAAPGYYYISADLVTKQLKATAVTWSLIGDAVGGWNTDVDMTYKKQGDVETWEVTTAMSAGAYKFRANHAWDINLGGTLGELSSGAANLNITQAGTYHITLYTSRNGADKKMYATAVKQ